MKIFYKNIIISILLTIGLSYYYSFSIAAHWIILFFVAALIILWLLSFLYSRKSFYQMFFLLELSFFFTYELFKASIQVAYEVITPKDTMEAGVIAMPLDVKTNIEITVLASLISLTPGTLSIDISEDRSHLFVHAMYIPHGDVEMVINELKEGFERRVIRIFN